MGIRSGSRSLALLAAAAGFAALTACSLLAPSDDELLGGSHHDAGKGGDASSSGGTTAGGTGGSSTGGTGAGGTGTGGTSVGGTGGAGGVGGTAGSSTGGSGGTGGTSCTPVTGGAVTPRPVVMYLFADRSTSMSLLNKWAQMTGGINAFATSNEAAGTQLALQFYQIEPDGTCAGAGWDTPLVAFAALPSNAVAIAQVLSVPNLLASQNFEGPANGAAKALNALAAVAPDAQYEAVFVTDSTLPPFNGGGCAGNPTALGNVTASHWPAVATYVIALQGATPSLLAPMAAGGGTVAPIDATANTSGAVQAALVRANRACRFAIPTGVSPAQLSFDLMVNGTTQGASNVAGAAACSGNGWFVSTTSASTAVLCPASCDALGSDSASTITSNVTCS